MLLSYFIKNVNKDQAKDTGIAIALICLLAAYITNKLWILQLTIIILILNMVWCGIYKPLAKIWFGTSHVIGTLTSKVLLCIIFAILVIPFGVVRRIGGIDSLYLKKWKGDDTSVFKIRDNLFGPGDLDNPY